MRIMIVAALLAVLSLISTISLGDTSHALKVDEGCTDVEAIFARGSGSAVDDKNLEAARYFTKIKDRIDPQKVSYHEYELGTESYGGSRYPAVAVDGWGFLNGLGASLSSGNHFTYGDSVSKGVKELQTYIAQRYEECQNSGTLYILGGYSQGAQVVGQALPGISKTIRDDIVYVGLFGDPKLHYPEGEGWNPPACHGERSVWRKVPVFNCNHDDGSLVARRPYLPEDMQTKTGLWCYDKDMVCDPGQVGQTSGHMEYKNDGRAIDHAAQIAVTRLQGRLKQDNPPPEPSEPNPKPPIDYNKALNVQRIFNQGTTGENVVFAVDVSETMRFKLPAIKEYLRQTSTKVIARGGKVAVAVYWGVQASDGKIYTAGYGIPFDQDILPLIDKIDSNHPTEFLFPGSALFVFDAAFNQLAWTPGATKSLIAFSDSPLISPDAHGLTTEHIAKRALEIDPVNIYPVVPDTVKDTYGDIAEQTSGQVLTYTDDLTNAANQAFDKITKRPVPILSNTEYRAETGQELTFDASDSYVVDASITKYDWDFEGDGKFDASTSTPSIKHTYANEFTGHLQVRISADNGTLANMSAKVEIGPITKPILPAAPKNLRYTITETVNNKSKVTVNWDKNTEAQAWLIQLNDMPMGYVELSRSSLEVTEIDRTNDVVIHVGSGSSSGDELVKGGFSSVTIPAIKTTPPPVVSTCTQSNFFVQLLCKAIAIIKVYTQGLWLYILPYKV